MEVDEHAELLYLENKNPRETDTGRNKAEQQDNQKPGKTRKKEKKEKEKKTRIDKLKLSKLTLNSSNYNKCK